jgi:glutamate dehydrogenase
MALIQKQELQEAISAESNKLEQYYLWMEKHLSQKFFDDADLETVMLVAHSLVGFNVQDYFSNMHFKNRAILLCLESPNADLQILRCYKDRGIKNYRTFVSNGPPPFPGVSSNLHVAIIYFTEFCETEEKEVFSKQEIEATFNVVKEQNPNVTEEEFTSLLAGMNSRFLRSLAIERLALAFNAFFRAKSSDFCQIEVRKKEDWADNKETPSLQIVLAWRNVPKHNFLYQLARIVSRYGLSLKRVAATHIDPYSVDNILLMSLGLHGKNGGAAWEEVNLEDFFQELVTFKYFPEQEMIETRFIDSKLVRGYLGALIKTMVSFVHQILVYADPNMYSFSNVEEGLCRHAELTVMLTQAFEAKFSPTLCNIDNYNKIKGAFFSSLDTIDTGNEFNDARRKNILKQAFYLIEYSLKTNFYCQNISAIALRLDPKYLDFVPYNRTEKFSELPFAVFFVNGMFFSGFHIRFRDLSRGGFRTVYPELLENFISDRKTLFSECYNLAFTQQKKNKDIPEGGAKAVILLEPYEQRRIEGEIYQHEMENSNISLEEKQQKLKIFHQEQKLQYLYQAQRSYVENFLMLVNCNPDGTLKQKQIIDYYGKPEYIYLGPDENLHNDMITWISNYATQIGYKPGHSFISSKPGAGINHKEYGVTSRGVNIYMEEVLKFLGIDPYQEAFTIKMTGGPDGDVAGNQMYNLYRFYPKNAKLLSTIDVSGVIYDPLGLNLEVLVRLFQGGKSIRFYPPEDLTENGFLLDVKMKKKQPDNTSQVLLLQKVDGKLVEKWISENEMNHIYRTYIHKLKADIFIPAGGRPRSLNGANYHDFLDKGGAPTAKAIVEAANLYLTPEAREGLEKLGVVIIKDSSANKGGVICSSFEVLAGLALTEEEFISNKALFVQDVLKIVENRAKEEARILLASHGKAFLTNISETISKKINDYKDAFLAYFTTLQLSSDPKDPLIRVFLRYCPIEIRIKYQEKLLRDVPDMHKKAVIACFLAQRLVYQKGLSWEPSVIDILPWIINDPLIVDE